MFGIAFTGFHRGDKAEPKEKRKREIPIQWDVIRRVALAVWVLAKSEKLFEEFVSRMTADSNSFPGFFFGEEGREIADLMLAESAGGNSWVVRSDALPVLNIIISGIWQTNPGCKMPERFKIYLAALQDRHNEMDAEHISPAELIAEEVVRRMS